MNMHDIISIGDTTVDVFLGIDEATVTCDIHKEHCKVCLSYADKIPVTSMEKIYAVGNAANNAVGASRLGMNAALYTILGNDDDGQTSRKRLREEGVSRRYIETDKKRHTNYSTVLNFNGERTILVYHEKRTYRLPRFGKADWVYLTSLGRGGESVFRELLGFVKKTRARLAFNPGTYQMKLGLEKLSPVLFLTDVLFVNKEEAERLLGHDNDVKTLLTELHAKGPKMVVITDGEKGSYVFDGAAAYFLPCFDTPVVERTGAGDSYATGFVAALANDRSVEDAMRWGTLNAASVVSYVGAQKGLLTKKELMKRLKKNSGFAAKRM